MSADVYRRLAEQLDRTPNGFPRTESGVELRLLARMFTSEEAQLGGVMSIAPETVAVIAERAGVEAQNAESLLEQMAAKGVAGRARGGDVARFSLRPFIVGSYESFVTRMDEEFAALVEEYFDEASSGFAREEPQVHRVLPVEKAIPFELEIFPYERAAELIEGAKAWGVRPCICRVQKTLIGKGCDHVVESCLVFAPVEGVFDDNGIDRAITKQESLDILRAAAEAGLIHSTGNYKSGNNYICNCCTCCCGVLRGVVDLGMSKTIARSGFLAVVDSDACTGCGACVARCQFSALSVDDACRVDAARCSGCGQCTLVCPVDALSLARLSDQDTVTPPADIGEWGVQRTKSRGLAESGDGS